MIHSIDKSYFDLDTAVARLIVAKKEAHSIFTPLEERKNQQYNLLGHIY
jgi:hypothetical protein